MKNHRKFCVKVTPQTSEALQKVAFANGYGWSGGNRIDYTDESYLHFSSDGCITYSGLLRSSDYEVIFTTAVEYLTGTKEDPKPIELTMGSFQVYIVPGESIKFGCTELYKDQVERLIAVWKGEA